jgi:hypothetical protein
MKREPSAWGYNWATLFLGDINTRSGPLGWGNLESETVEHGYESRWTRIREYLRWRGPTAIVNDRPILLSERTLTARVHLKKKMLVVSLKGLGTKTI